MFKKLRFDLTQLAEILNTNEYKCIAGKWYHKDTEIPNIRAHLAKNGYLELCGSLDKLDNLIETFELIYGYYAYWPELPIIGAAKNILTSSFEMPKPVIELTRQQKIIIRALLEHKDSLFIICGAGGSGKSTFLNLIRQIFNYLTRLSLQQALHIV